MFRSLLLLLSLSTCLTALAQKGFVEAKVTLKDGTIKKGLIKPMKTGSEKTLDYLANKEAEKEKIPTEQIEEYSIIDENGSARYVKRKEYNYTKTKVKPTAFWVQELVQGEASLYVSYTPDSRIYTNNGMAHGMPSDITFYGMKKGDEAMTLIGVYFTGAFNLNANSSFRNQAAKFFEDEQKIVERIKNEEFKLVESVRLFEAYNELKGGKAVKMKRSN